MTAVTDHSGGGFRFGMLLSDTRYRSTTIQIIALVAVFVAGYWLVDNVIANLAALGKEFGFQFMAQPANYDINQLPIDYNSRDSNARAAVIGILNTLLVAIVGCALATLIGVLAGVARLSRNWIVARLMTVYIEGVRNIPVLIQILLFAAFINETLPQPNAFRGENPEASMLFDAVAITGRGLYLPRPIWQDGSLWVIAAFILGIVLAVIVGRWAHLRQLDTGQETPTLAIKLGLILGLPLIAFFVFGMPVGVEYPELKGFNFQGGLFARDSYVALTLALSIYTGAFIAENVRAGIQSVSKGQTEAAYALGLHPGKTMRLVVLPQALRVIIPPMISQYLNLTKNSSLALLVGYMDATGTLGGITLNQTGKEFECLFLLMAFYLAISLSIAAIMNLYNENVRLVERTSAGGIGSIVMSLLDGFTGKWEQLKKGDAINKRDYGIRAELNLYVLFYGAMLLMLLDYVFLRHASPDRPSYYSWDMSVQVAAVLMIGLTFGTLITCMFKSPRFLDLAVVELIVFAYAVAAGFPFGELSPLGGAAMIWGGLAARIAIIAYTLFGERPNLTFYHRVREA
jgi:general L-amino acid transport system permease protein